MGFVMFATAVPEFQLEFFFSGQNSMNLWNRRVLQALVFLFSQQV
jgi:hypothetical protein